MKINALTTLKEVRAESERVKEELRRRTLEQELRDKVTEDKKPS